MVQGQDSISAQHCIVLRNQSYPSAPTYQPSNRTWEVQPYAALPLQEYEDHGTFRGCCSVGFRWQDMENQHLREHFKVGSPIWGT